MKGYWSVMNITIRISSCCRLPTLFSSCTYPPFILWTNSCMVLVLTKGDSPGDYLHPHEEELSGFRNRLNERLAPVGNQFSGEGVNDEWEIGDTLAQWWRPNFETFMYPFIPAHVTRPKECKKLYFIQLPRSSMFSPLCPFTSPKYFSLFAITNRRAIYARVPL